MQAVESPGPARGLKGVVGRSSSRESIPRQRPCLCLNRPPGDKCPTAERGKAWRGGKGQGAVTAGLEEHTVHPPLKSRTNHLGSLPGQSVTGKR